MKKRVLFRRWKAMLSLLLAAGLLVIGALVHAGVSAHYRLEPQSVNAAGGERDSGAYRAWGVGGEALVGPSASADYRLFSGVDLSRGFPPQTAARDDVWPGYE